MKIKTDKLADIALDFAVAKSTAMCVDHNFLLGGIEMPGWFVQIDGNYWKPLEHFNPSTDWAQGGPIIERREIGIRRNAPCSDGRQWEAIPSITAKGAGGKYGYGPTPLIAAMRCYVASNLGDEVEIPDELLS